MAIWKYETARAPEMAPALCAMARRTIQATGKGRGPPYQLSNQTPMPAGKKIAEAISSGRLPLDAQNTIEVSHAE